MSLRYTKDHEWVRVEGEVAVVGVSKYATEQLGDVVTVELPEIGKSVKQHGGAAVVDSVKAASDVFAPLSGEVIAVNDALADAPETVNEDPEGEGWFFKLKIAKPDEIDGLMDAAAYAEFLTTLE